MSITNFDRTLAVDEARKKSARADMKQHADKLIQGFEKLSESHAKRAVWELVQNACDLSDHCEIVIDFSNDQFSFTHNGKPFSSETLISLIKQVSSKTPDKTDDVGQFGTGFITTHSFGKKFIVVWTQGFAGVGRASYTPGGASFVVTRISRSIVFSPVAGST